MRRAAYYKKLAIGGLMAFVTLIAIPLTASRLNNNFHPVIDGQIYRSAQPSAEEIADYKREYGIATIINLRGNNAGESWYDDEVNASAKFGIKHVDFTMSASRELTPAQSLALIETMREARKPILIHCNSGSNRTGLASALYLAGIAQTDEEQAESQLSLFYGHIGVPLVPTYAMDRSFESVEPILGFEKS